MTHSYLYIYIYKCTKFKDPSNFLLNTNNNFCNSLKCLLNVYYSNKTKYVLFFLAHPLSSFRCGVPLSPKAGRSVAPDAGPAVPSRRSAGTPGQRGGAPRRAARRRPFSTAAACSPRQRQRVTWKFSTHPPTTEGAAATYFCTS